MGFEMVPRHIAMIMDGNRRWAEKNGVSTLEGHEAGAKTVRRVVDYCQVHGVKYLTLYAFSTENWKRPPIEVKGLMGLLTVFLRKYIREMNEKGVKLDFIGRIDGLPSAQRNAISEAIKSTSANKNWNLVLAVNYGGRSEIIDATVKMASDIASGLIKAADINEEKFRKFLYYPSLPDPDLLIRTSGETRLSNFLLWQVSYSEIYFSKVLWPDFSEDDFKEALKFYSEKQRRFGGR